MPEASHILILSVPVPHSSTETSKSRPVPFRRSSAVVVRFLRLLGFHFTTVSEALRSPPGRYACLTIDDPDRPCLAAAAAEFARLKAPATVFVAANSIAHASWSPENPSSPPLAGAIDESKVTWSDLRTLTQTGWEVGSGGTETVNLAERSQSEQRALVARSRKIVAAGLGHQPRIFAYPFGAYDATTVSLVREAGFRAAVTLKRGSNACHGDAFHLKRWSLADFRLRDLASLAFQALSSPPIDASPLIATTRAPTQAQESGAL